MKVVYLDQNKWIALAQVAYGKSNDARVANALHVAVQARDLKQVCSPTSFSHLMETYRNGDGAKRERLAEFMLELSGGLTVCPSETIVRHEIEQALRDRFEDDIDPRKLASLNLLGYGLEHTSGRVGLSKETKERISNLPLQYQEALNHFVEKGMLSGVLPDIPGLLKGTVARRTEAVTIYEETFVNHLAQVHEVVSPLDKETQEAVIHFFALRDILGEINDAVDRLGLPVSPFAIWSKDELLDFVDAMPTRQVEVHLHRQWLRNKQLKATRTELIDWGQTAPMAMYADVVVTEKKLADLLNRPGLKKKAVVMTDLGRLPEVLIGGRALS